MFVENGEVEVVERGRVIGGWEPKGILKIINGIVVRCKEQKLRAFIVEADRTCREIERTAATVSTESREERSMWLLGPGLRSGDQCTSL